MSRASPLQAQRTSHIQSKIRSRRVDHKYNQSSLLTNCSLLRVLCTLLILFLSKGVFQFKDKFLRPKPISISMSTWHMKREREFDGPMVVGIWKNKIIINYKDTFSRHGKIHKFQLKTSYSVCYWNEWRLKNKDQRVKRQSRNIGRLMNRVKGEVY